MALTFLRLAKLCLLLGALLSFIIATIASPEKLVGMEKLTHLHFYVHENLTGAFPNVVQVAEAPGITNKSLTSFGAVSVVDSLILTGPERSSAQIGRAQGLTVSASRDDVAPVVAIVFAFTAGKFNGSSLTMLGRNQFSRPERELPVVGGTGNFRFSRGYVKTTTYFTPDCQTSGLSTILQFHVYVLHY